MAQEWDWPPRRFRPQLIEGTARRIRQRAPAASWHSPRAKLAANLSFGSAIFAIKTGTAIALGLIGAGGVWFLALLAKTS